MIDSGAILAAVEVIQDTCRSFSYCTGCPFATEDNDCVWQDGRLPSNVEVNQKALDIIDRIGGI